MANTRAISSELLESALLGLEIQKHRIDEQIAQVKALLGKRGPGRPKLQPTANGDGEPHTRARFSPETRARMADAQRQRWANAKGESQPSKTTKKRRLSPEGRKRIADAAKKRWAAYKKQQKA